MLNSHCNNNGKKKKRKKKYIKNKINMRLPRFDLRIYGFKNIVVVTTLWRPMELIDKINQYMLKL